MTVVQVSVGPTHHSDGPTLTFPETQTLHAIATGTRPNPNDPTTRQHLDSILTKLNANSLAHAVYIACQNGVLDGRRRRHGDHAGFAQHQRAGEEPCEACWEAERRYRGTRRRVRAHAAWQ
ncbi:MULTISPECIES: hypothetical protein [Streptomyces]|uniref:hypothetical protein n=1 Tax=Streptomyces TaxID=1883 RepID=UPI0037AF1736